MAKVSVLVVTLRVASDHTLFFRRSQGTATAPNLQQVTSNSPLQNFGRRRASTAFTSVCSNRAVNMLDCVNVGVTVDDMPELEPCNATVTVQSGLAQLSLSPPNLLSFLALTIS